MSRRVSEFAALAVGMPSLCSLQEKSGERTGVKDNTERFFGEKWERNPQALYSETLRSGSQAQSWILERNGFSSAQDFSQHLSRAHRILDAGCGNGRVTALLRALAPEEAVVVGIDVASALVAQEQFAGVESVRFEQRDLLDDLSSLGQFDFIYCQEVLHHTEDPARAFCNLSELLAPDGEIAVYVYKHKAPVREWVDDFVRDELSSLSYEKATQSCAQITEFGQRLSDLNVTVSVPAVKVLGIEAGEYDVQRLIYHFFAKCFWSEELSWDENVLVNQDWYHPQTATRHTREEVEAWFMQAGLDLVHRHVDHYGITLRGVRRGSSRESAAMR